MPRGRKKPNVPSKARYNKQKNLLDESSPSPSTPAPLATTPATDVLSPPPQDVEDAGDSDIEIIEVKPNSDQFGKWSF